MSKKNQLPEASWGYGWALSDDAPNRIIGNVLTLVEILGLSEKQEKPFKDLIHQRVWDCFNDGISLSPETHTDLRNKYYKQYEEDRINNNPPSAI